MRWMWIDRIIDYEPGRRLVPVKAVSRAEEYLHDHLPAEDGREALPVMPASLMIEGMAQTAGILVGSVNEFQEKVILAKIVRARFEADVFPGATIRYEAAIDRMDDVGALTAGSVSRLEHPEATWQTIGEVDLLFSHLDRNLSGLEFPEENFVFSESLRALIEDSGFKVQRSRPRLDA